MALGTITQLNLNSSLSASEPGQGNMGGLRVTRNTVVGDAAYPTGGSALTPAQLGLPNSVLFAIVTLHGAGATDNDAVAARYDEVNEKLQCFSLTDAAGVPAAETANAVNLSGLTWDVVAFGY